MSPTLTPAAQALKELYPIWVETNAKFVELQGQVWAEVRTKEAGEREKNMRGVRERANDRKEQEKEAREERRHKIAEREKRADKIAKANKESMNELMEMIERMEAEQEKIENRGDIMDRIKGVFQGMDRELSALREENCQLRWRIENLEEWEEEEEEEECATN